MNIEEIRFLQHIEIKFSSSGFANESQGLAQIVNLGNALGLDSDEETREPMKTVIDISKELLNSPPVLPKIGPEEDRSVLDYRFLEIFLNGIRYFPQTKEKEPQFGIKMYTESDNGRGKLPNSIVILGANGSGKSSMFDALQWLCINEVSEMQLREADKPPFQAAEDGLRDFMRHVSSETPAKDQIKVNTVHSLTSQSSTTQDDFSLLQLSPFFLSERNLLQMIASTPKKAGESWNDFFYKLCGYEHIVDLISKLSQIQKALKEDFKRKSINEPHASRMRDLMNNIQIFIPFALTSKGKNLSKKIKTYSEIGEKLNAFIGKDKSTNPKPFWDEFKASVFDEYFSLNNLANDFKKQFPWENHIRTAIERLLIEPTTPGKPGYDPVAELKDLKEAAKFLLEALTAFIERAQKYEDEGRAWCEQIKMGKTDFSDLVDTKSDDQKNLKTLVACINEYCDYCKNQLNERVLSLVDLEYFNQIKNFWESRGFLKTSNSKSGTIKEELCMSITNDKILCDLRFGNDSQMTSVSKYFNTFRLKLFVLTLRTFLVIRIMRDNGFRFPILMDDIFYSSDYDNKYKLAHYFKDLFEFCESNIKDEFLQIILFTHDEQIMSVAQLALKDQENIIFGRLYDYHYPAPPQNIEEDAIGKEKYQRLYVTL